MLSLPCEHYQRGECLSCHWLDSEYENQLARKMAHLRQQLKAYTYSIEWHEPFRSELSGFRNKAKMVVSGAVERPILGILRDPNDPQSAVDLCDCLLYPNYFAEYFPILKDFIGRAGLVPYNIMRKKGELKYILLTESRYDRKIMVRFVLRSEQKLALIKRELSGLQQKIPRLSVVSVNIQPEHCARLEGEKEIFLTEHTTLLEQFNEIPLFIRPQGFFQTNPNVAQGLYATAQQWITQLILEGKTISHLWDLFCGVGGFGLHCAQALKKYHPDIRLTGIEISASAIHSATLSAQQLGLENVHFQSLDAALFAECGKQDIPELIIVNPPRRGIGEEFAIFLDDFRPQFILYSSCNAESMARDLSKLKHYTLRQVQLFDMFPHSSHYEVLALLECTGDIKHEEQSLSF